MTNSQVDLLVTIIGGIGAVIAMVAFLPQTLKTIKSKKTKGISIWTFLLYSVANTAWILYAILQLTQEVDASRIIVLIANIGADFWSCIILGIKIYNMIHYHEDRNYNFNKKLNIILNTERY